MSLASPFLPPNPLYPRPCGGAGAIGAQRTRKAGRRREAKSTWTIERIEIGARNGQAKRPKRSEVKRVGKGNPYQFERVVKPGYGTDWGEADEGIHCVVAPVFDRPDHLLAVARASAVAGRMPKGRFAAVAVEVIRAAREIERRLRA